MIIAKYSKWLTVAFVLNAIVVIPIYLAFFTDRGLGRSRAPSAKLRANLKGIAQQVALYFAPGPDTAFPADLNAFQFPSYIYTRSKLKRIPATGVECLKQGFPYICLKNPGDNYNGSATEPLFITRTDLIQEIDSENNSPYWVVYEDTHIETMSAEQGLKLLRKLSQQNGYEFKPPSNPKISLLILLSTVYGGTLVLFIVMIRRRNRKAKPQKSASPLE